MNKDDWLFVWQVLTTLFCWRDLISRVGWLLLSIATMQSYIGTGYPVMFFNMASRASWYDALHHGVLDAGRPTPQLLQPPAVELVRRPTRHYIADILDLRDDDDDADDGDTDDDETVPVKHVWTSLSPSPPSISSNADDLPTSPGSVKDIRITTTSTSAGHHGTGSDSSNSDSPPSDVDVNYASDHGTSENSELSLGSVGISLQELGRLHFEMFEILHRDWN